MLVRLSCFSRGGCLTIAHRPLLGVAFRAGTRRDDDDYDIDFYTVGPVPPSSSVDAHAQSPSVREQLEVGPFFLFRVASLT